jgi:hypothetical protein
MLSAWRAARAVHALCRREMLAVSCRRRLPRWRSCLLMSVLTGVALEVIAFVLATLALWAGLRIIG